MVAAIGSAVFSLAFKLFWPELPFIDRVGIVFLLCLALPALVVMLQKAKTQPNSIELSGIDFATSRRFNIGSIGVVIVLIAFYTTWW